MSFWREADAQAAREYGARYWRWFTAVRVLRVVWPALAALGVVAVIVLAWRWSLSAVGSLDARETAQPILWTLGAIAVMGVLALGVRGAVRYFGGPPRRRRRFR